MKTQKTSDATSTKNITVLVYGQSGAGKTRLCATVPDPSKCLILSAEGGLLSLRDYEIDFSNITSMAELTEAYKWLKSGEHPYTWVCIDSISEVAELCLLEEQFKARDSNNKWKAFDEYAIRMLKLMRRFRDLPMSVYMTAKMAKVDYVSETLYGPVFPGRKLDKDVPHLFDELFCMHPARDEDGKVRRYLQTDSDAHYLAKDRSGALDSAEAPSLKRIHQKIQGTHTPTTANNKTPDSQDTTDD